MENYENNNINNEEVNETADETITKEAVEEAVGEVVDEIPAEEKQEMNDYTKTQSAYSQPQPINEEVPQEAQGYAIASLVFGIVSFFCMGFICGILALIFGIIAKNKDNKSGMATAGVVLGVIALVVQVIAIIVSVTAGVFMYN